MKRHGTPRWKVIVWGDWATIISVKQYRELLIDQNPCYHDDGDLCDYFRYSIPCATAEEMVEAYRTFRAHHFRCEFECSFISDDEMTAAEMTTGFDGDKKPMCTVGFQFPQAKAESAIKQAVEILQGAIK